MPLKKLVKQTEKIEETTEKIEETGEKIEEKVDDLKQDLKQDNEEIKNVLESLKTILQESIGVLGVYKDIIRTQRKNNFILFILIFVLILTLVHNQMEFAVYRENSMHKDEIIKILGKCTYNSGDNSGD